VRRASASRPPVEIRTVRLSKHFVIRGLIPGRPRARITALHDVNLHVEAGSIHGLIGPNGSGKSTLLRTLATLVLPTAGQAFVGAHEVTASPLDVRRQIGFSTGEERSLYWRLTGRQNLEFYAALYHLPDVSRRTAAVLERLGLAEVADQPVSTFSQGMARRLGLARAILHHPPVLLLDEPARSLDPLSRERLHALMGQLRDEEGTTILIATQDLAEAAELCSRVTIMRRGRAIRVLAPRDASDLQTAFHEAME
jgi:ABC-2 type transport system ATP-binding protein